MLTSTFMKLPPYSMTVAAEQWVEQDPTHTSKTFTSSSSSGSSHANNPSAGDMAGTKRSAGVAPLSCITKLRVATDKPRSRARKGLLSATSSIGTIDHGGLFIGRIGPGGVFVGSIVPGGVFAGTIGPGGVFIGTIVPGGVFVGTIGPGGVFVGTIGPGASS